MRGLDQEPAFAGTGGGPDFTGATPPLAAEVRPAPPTLADPANDAGPGSFGSLSKDFSRTNR